MTLLRFQETDKRIGKSGYFRLFPIFFWGGEGKSFGQAGWLDDSVMGQRLKIQGSSNVLRRGAKRLAIKL